MTGLAARSLAIIAAFPALMLIGLAADLIGAVKRAIIGGRLG